MQRAARDGRSCLRAHPVELIDCIASRREASDSLAGESQERDSARDLTHVKVELESVPPF